MASKSTREHTVVDLASDEQAGAQLVTLRCFCGAELGEDYEKYPLHLAKHSPEDIGLGGEDGAE